MSNIERIGLFGGSFNPPHCGHVFMARYFVEKMNLDKCFFIPAAQSPFKTENDYLDFTAEQRLAMVRAIKPIKPEFEVNESEILRGGLSYTHETVEDFAGRYPDAELFWLLGKDHLFDFPDWRHPEIIIKHATVVIVNRDDKISEKERIFLDEKIGQDNYIILDSPIVDISATEIRENLEKPEELRKLVPLEVLPIILESRKK